MVKQVVPEIEIGGITVAVLFGLLLGFTLVYYFSTKGRIKQHRSFVLLLIALMIALIESFLSRSGILANVPHLLNITTPLIFLLGPFTYTYVLDQLGDLFGIVEIPLVDGQANVTSHAEDPKPLSSDNPKPLSIGEQNIQSLVTVYEPRKEYPTEVEFLGKGYKLTIGAMTEEGQLQYNVAFPKYPYPKEPVN